MIINKIGKKVEMIQVSDAVFASTNSTNKHIKDKIKSVDYN